jgi:hypothetical protein
MVEKPLTKSQRRRRNEKMRKQQQKLLDEIFEFRPQVAPERRAYFLDNSNTRPFEEQAAFERAPAHVVEYGEDYIGLDNAVLRRMTNAATEKRIEEKLLRVRELKAKYPELWGKRGTPKIIASHETDEGNPLSERTVQGYFKLKI